MSEKISLDSSVLKYYGGVIPGYPNPFLYLL